MHSAERANNLFSFLYTIYYLICIYIHIYIVSYRFLVGSEITFSRKYLTFRGHPLTSNQGALLDLKWELRINMLHQIWRNIYLAIYLRSAFFQFVAACTLPLFVVYYVFQTFSSTQAYLTDWKHELSPICRLLKNEPNGSQQLALLDFTLSTVHGNCVHDEYWFPIFIWFN